MMLREQYQSYSDKDIEKLLKKILKNNKKYIPIIML